MQSRQILFLLPLLVVFAFTNADAQTISGQVIDAQSMEPLFGANISQPGSTSGTSTDEEGHYELTLTDDAPARIQVSYIGYETLLLAIETSGEQPIVTLSPQTVVGGDIFVSSLRVDESDPIAFSNISRAEIDRRNLGQDIPFLVSSTPSVVTTSDAGAGIGYTGIRVRGVDPARINVTINGIPVNDSESHGVFWVNMPDLASSVESIQIQRGVGTSTHGAGAFGATMNLQTALMNPTPYTEVQTTVGAFNTQRYNVNLGSGRFGDGWQFEGRLSKITSDGYIDRASSDLKSFYLSGSRSGDRSLLKADVFSGQERTYQAWNGVPEPILENDAGEIERYINNLYGGATADHFRSNLGNRRFNEYLYENQVDNYQQDHYQLHYSYQFTTDWMINSSLHYTYGRGYYEQFRDEDDLSNYGISPITIGNETIESSDIIRRRWLDNHFYGLIVNSEYNHNDQWDLTIGGGYNEYDGDHFGEVIWARFAGDSSYEDRYYSNNGFKTDFNIFGKFNLFLSEKVNTYLDLQYRTLGYSFLGKSVEVVGGEEQPIDIQQDVRINFFNPKTGVVYQLDDTSRLFASVSIGGKEPTRDDYVESTLQSRPKPERLTDYEVGYVMESERYSLGANLYYMNYKDQLVLTGAINDVGAYVRENVDNSYRAGVELQGSVLLVPGVTLSANATMSRNKIPEYTQYIDNFDVGGQDAITYEDSDIAFSPNFISNATLSYEQGNWTGALLSKYVSRQYLDNTQTTSRSMDPYFVQDLQVGHRVPSFLRTGALSLSLQVNNLFDFDYVSNGYTFGWIAGGQQEHFNYYYPQAGRHVMFRAEIAF